MVHDGLGVAKGLENRIAVEHLCVTQVHAVWGVRAFRAPQSSEGVAVV